MNKKIVILFFSICCAGCSLSSATLSNQTRTAIYFETIKHAPTNQLHDFLYAMPKGADLHSHVSGATYAENLIDYNLGGGFCIDTILFVAQAGNGCNPFFALDNLPSNPNLETAAVDAWSMQNFNFANGPGHDHFFATFSKFGALVRASYPLVLAEIMNRAGSQNELYLELMLTPDGTQVANLGTALGWNSDLNVMYEKLINSGQLPNFVTQVHQSLTTYTTEALQAMSCGTISAQAGCHVEVRFLYQVLREQAPERVFAQFLLGFETANQLKEIVGINLVQPEDGSIALNDYILHMQMVQFLKQKYPKTKVSLHAGELTPQFASGKDLTFHVTAAVEIAGANRIGHGVDVKYEINYPDLLKKMAANKILVEISLVSNQDVLGVDKSQHPFPTYLANNVPTTLSTDDEGILRTNLTAQYIKAAQDYDLDYLTLKTISRNSLEYSFLPGLSLWEDGGRYQAMSPVCADNDLATIAPNPICQQFLDGNEKAQLQWNLEKKWADFEARIWNN